MVGQTQTDDLSVPDDSYVLRRIPPGHYVFDPTIERTKPQSGNFDDDREGNPCSVVLSVVLKEQNRNDLEVLEGHSGFLLARVPVHVILGCGLGVERAPRDDEAAHGHIVGRKTKSKKTN